MKGSEMQSNEIQEVHTLIKYFYAFAYDMVLDSDFEQWLYNHIDSVEAFLNRKIFMDLYECDFGCNKSIYFTKQKLCQYFAQQFEAVCEADFYEGIDKSLLAMLERCEEATALRGKLIIECHGIATAKQLQKRLQIICRFPDWYGLNWNAFNDLIDLSEVDEIQLIGFADLKDSLPSEADTLLNKLAFYKNKSCKILFE